MNTLEFKEGFFNSLKIIKDVSVLKNIKNKIEKLKHEVPIGKKLVKSPYWSIRVSRFRIIYRFKGKLVTLVRILPRKQDYRELGKLE